MALPSNGYKRKLAAVGMDGGLPTTIGGVDANSQEKSLHRRRTRGRGRGRDFSRPLPRPVHRPDTVRRPDTKDGRTHLAYKAEHAVDLETDAIVAAEMKPVDQGDTESGAEMLKAADQNLLARGNEAAVQACVADKGYHDTGMIVELKREEIRTYIPERRQRVHRWTDKPELHQKAFPGNRRRATGARGGRLSRWRSERCERAFAHLCDMGHGRRVCVRGLKEAAKLHRMRCVAYNLGLPLREVFRMVKPRGAGSVFG